MILYENILKRKECGEEEVGEKGSDGGIVGEEIETVS